MQLCASTQMKRAKSPHSDFSERQQASLKRKNDKQVWSHNDKG
jgi:hypothetical protein